MYYVYQNITLHTKKWIRKKNVKMSKVFLPGKKMQVLTLGGFSASGLFAIFKMHAN